MDRRWLAGIVLVLLCAGVWWLRGGRETQRSDAASPGASELSSAQRGQTEELPAESVERAPVQLATKVDGDDSATATVATTAVEQEQLTKLFGAVRPDPSRAELYDKRIGVAAVDEWGERLVTHTSESGEYAFDGLRAGRYWISASAPRDGEARAGVELTPGERERRLDLELALPLDVWVKVIDAHGARPKTGWGMLAVATRERPGEWFDEVRGSFNNPFGVGRFWQNRQESEPRDENYLGRVVLDVAPPVWVSLLSFQRVIASQQVHPGQREVVFELSDDDVAATQGVLRARFVSAQTGEPVAGAMVTLDNCGSRPMNLDADGRVEAPKLCPGWCTVRVSAKGLENSELCVRIASGVVTDLGEVALHPERSISGAVVDQSGVGLELFVMHTALDPATREPAPNGVQHGVRSSSSGEFRIGRLSARLYELRFDSRESRLARAATVVDLREGNVENLRVVIPNGTPLVLSSHEHRWRDVRFELIDSKGQRVLRSRLSSPAPWRVLVAPDRYTLIVTTPDSALPHVREVLVGSEPVPLRVP